MPRTPARDRLREAKDAMYREVILDAAERSFGNRGFEATKMQDVASDAGVSSSTVYATFEGKQDLFRAVHERRGRELFIAVREDELATGTGFVRLLGGIRAYAGFLMEHPDYLRMLGHERVWTHSRELGSEEQATSNEAGHGMVSKAFADGADEGDFRTDDSPGLMARLMTAMHQVRLLDWLESDERQEPQAVVRAMHVELVHTFARPERLSALLDQVSAG